jgi:hypothetical protein
MSKAALLVSVLALAPLSADTATWLDRALTNWNKPGELLAPPSGQVAREAIRSRCQIASAQSAGQRALEQAGWVAYNHLDLALAKADVEIVAGMTDADAACRPRGFQLFVFVGAALTGTLSPETMTTGLDASAGAVRIVAPDVITAEFARYGNKDMPCCPTSRMTVRYRIDRSGAQPILVPIEVRTTRSH